MMLDADDDEEMRTRRHSKRAVGHGAMPAGRAADVWAKDI